jgi:2-phospho-L-lactate guanylyltransferase
VKSFTMAKGRLADTLSASQRSALAQSCAETVVRAALSLPTYVVCSDESVATWATSLGAHVVDCQTPGLDVAVAAGRAVAVANGADHIIVAHADLPLAVNFDHIAREGKVSLVPDRHHDGTNVLSFPASSTFTTAYGPGSCDNHIRLALDAGLEYEIIVDDALALDLDTADDLSELARRETEQS